MWTAHGKWNEKRRPAHKLWLCVCPAQRNQARSPRCVYIRKGMYITYMHKSPVLNLKGRWMCSSSQSAQWSAVWKAARSRWRYPFYLHSRLCSLGGQCVPEIKQWCYYQLFVGTKQFRASFNSYQTWSQGDDAMGTWSSNPGRGRSCRERSHWGKHFHVPIN